MRAEAITPPASIMTRETKTENVRGTRAFHPAAYDESSALDENIFSAEWRRVGWGGEGGGGLAQRGNNCGLTIGGTGRDKGKEDVAIRTLMQRGERRVPLSRSIIVAVRNEHFRYERARNA